MKKPEKMPRNQGIHLPLGKDYQNKLEEVKKFSNKDLSKFLYHDIKRVLDVQISDIEEIVRNESNKDKTFYEGMIDQLESVYLSAKDLKIGRDLTDSRIVFYDNWLTSFERKAYELDFENLAKKINKISKQYVSPEKQEELRKLSQSELNNRLDEIDQVVENVKKMVEEWNYDNEDFLKAENLWFILKSEVQKYLDDDLLSEEHQNIKEILKNKFDEIKEYINQANLQEEISKKSSLYNSGVSELRESFEKIKLEKSKKDWEKALLIAEKQEKDVRSEDPTGVFAKNIEEKLSSIKDGVEEQSLKTEEFYKTQISKLDNEVVTIYKSFKKRQQKMNKIVEYHQKYNLLIQNAIDGGDKFNDLKNRLDQELNTFFVGNNLNNQRWKMEDDDLDIEIERIKTQLEKSETDYQNILKS
ncbi:hypothetical protein [Mycoplasmopsis arginini]|uniref:hypothetical protein n=1 Tax=Mycoplasmopsis arginini TaxID=2094 RepID=UPI003D088188